MNRKMLTDEYASRKLAGLYNTYIHRHLLHVCIYWIPYYRCIGGYCAHVTQNLLINKKKKKYFGLLNFGAKKVKIIIIIQKLIVSSLA